MNKKCILQRNLWRNLYKREYHAMPICMSGNLWPNIFWLFSVHERIKSVSFPQQSYPSHPLVQKSIINCDSVLKVVANVNAAAIYLIPYIITAGLINWQEMRKREVFTLRGDCLRKLADESDWNAKRNNKLDAMDKLVVWEQSLDWIHGRIPQISPIEVRN